MQARRPDSKKWTSLPKEYLQQIREVFTQNFQDKLPADSEIIVEGRIYKAEITMRVGYLEKSRIRQFNFEVSMNYNKQKEDIANLIYTAIDTIGSMINQHFHDDSLEFPLNWKSFKVKSKEIFLRYSQVNSKLEDQADQILGIQKEGLVKDDSNSDKDPDPDEKEAIKEKLGLNKES